METNQYALLKNISEVEFVCVELNEYIDTHPCDQKARADYYCFSKKLNKLMREYESQFGPLLNFGHSPTDKGCWICMKWPWEL